MIEYNPNIFSSKSYFIKPMIREIRDNGGIDFWVLNKTYYEIYHFKCTQISEFDVHIDLNNALEQEHVFSTVLVLHMKDKIMEILEQVPGKVYISKLDCYRELYQTLNEKIITTKSKKMRLEMESKVEYLETEFPELLI